MSDYHKWDTDRTEEETPSVIKQSYNEGKADGRSELESEIEILRAENERLKGCSQIAQLSQEVLQELLAMSEDDFIEHLKKHENGDIANALMMEWDNSADKKLADLRKAISTFFKEYDNYKKTFSVCEDENVWYGHKINFITAEQKLRDMVKDI